MAAIVGFGLLAITGLMSQNDETESRENPLPHYPISESKQHLMDMIQHGRGELVRFRYGMNGVPEYWYKVGNGLIKLNRKF